MVLPIGSFVNAAAIIAGSLAGMALHDLGGRLTGRAPAVAEG